MSIEATFTEEELWLYRFASLGAKEERKERIAKEISVLLTNFWKQRSVFWDDYWGKASQSVEEFWDKYKVEILAGAEAATLIATTAAATVATGGAYTIVAGAAVYQTLRSIREKLEQEQSETPAFTLDSPPSWEPVFISKNFEIPGTPLLSGAIGGIAGINTSQLENEVYASNMHLLANKSHIYWTYNQSHGIALDILETWLLNYRGVSAPAKLLARNWRKFDRKHKNNPDAKFLQICHSQGASHVRNALQQTSPELRQRVIVLALAPAEVVPKALCYNSHNYSSKRDIIYYGKLFSNPGALPENIKNLEEIQFLEPDPSAPLFDHGFQSPTFEPVLREHVLEFLAKYG